MDVLENSREVCAEGKIIARIAPGMFCGGRNATVEEQDANATAISLIPEMIAILEMVASGEDCKKIRTLFVIYDLTKPMRPCATRAETRMK